MCHMVGGGAQVVEDIENGRRFFVMGIGVLFPLALSLLLMMGLLQDADGSSGNPDSDPCDLSLPQLFDFLQCLPRDFHSMLCLIHSHFYCCCLLLLTCNCHHSET
ncbi:hypothetical protein L1049_024728 [Liquidambar formosana]|uniref:Uncharacterized protein n=1 Tax=Liquidambar formosana TaxID=63359 RepID=A0AAP0X4X8_LIQFO